jgi:hypothetical protein
MRAEHSVNLRKRVLLCGFATTARLFLHCSKSEHIGKPQQIERVDDHTADAGRARRKAPDQHLANLRLTHAEILFTRKIACTSLAG